MLSRSQQILVKRAQREAGLGDLDYRGALEMVSGCRSTTDARMTDRHVDLVMGYFEAIYWRKVDLGELQPNCKAGAVLGKRGYWAGRNPREMTSRDRYTISHLSAEIAKAEAALASLGFGEAYCAAIKNKTSGGHFETQVLRTYLAALRRTLRAKQNFAAGSSRRPVRDSELSRR